MVTRWTTGQVVGGIALAAASLVGVAGVLASARKPRPRPTFRLFTRSPSPTTQAKLARYVRLGDRLWGGGPIPPANLAYTFTREENLQRATYQDLLVPTLNGDIEDSDPAVVKALVLLGRARITDLLTRYPTHEMEYSGFIHMNVVDADPSVIDPLDIFMFGKSMWVAPSVVSDYPTLRNLLAEAPPYVALAAAHHVTPGVLLSDYYNSRDGSTTLHYTVDQLIANFHAVLDPPPAGLGLGVVGFFYFRDEVDRLIGALASLRSVGVA